MSCNKETLFGIVPEDWKVDNIGEIFTLSQGLQIASKKRIQEERDGYIPLLKITDLPHKNFSEFVTNIESQYIANMDDIVYTRTGNVGLVYTDVEGCVHNNCFKVHFEKEKFDKYYVYYYLKSQQVFTYSNQVASGSVQKDLTHPAFKSCLFAYPDDLKEQEKIGQVLKTFDDKIELNNQMNQTLEEMATALFKEWFENFNFPNSNGKPYKDNGGEMKASELGEIPIDWEVCSIGDYVEILGGGTPSTKNESYWIGGDINWFSPTDITKSNTMFYSKSAKKINKNGLDNSSAKEFPAYSLMLTSRATVGEIGINTEVATTNQGFITLIPNETFSLKYLYFWLHSKLDEIHSLASGSTFKEISKRDFKKLKILKFDNKLLESFEKKTTPIFEKIENNQKENEFLKNLRDELLPKLMSGEKRV